MTWIVQLLALPVVFAGAVQIGVRVEVLLKLPLEPSVEHVALHA